MTTTTVQDTAAVEEGVSSVPPQEDSRVTWKDFWENRRVLGFCLLIYMLPVNFGYEISNVGHLLGVDAFLHRFGRQVGTAWVIAATDQQLLNSASTIGIFSSAFCTGYMSDLFGRKKVIIFACLICVAGILTQYFAATVPQLFGGKLISCFGFGLGHSLGPVYVAELAPVKLRGFCLALVNTMIILGQWLNSLAVYSSSKTHHGDDMSWRIPMITQIIPPAILLLGLPFLPESPSWLILKGRHDAAAKAFRTFNGPNFDVDGAMAVLTAAVMTEHGLERQNKASSWMDCFRQPNGRRTLIICMVYIAQQFVGVNFITGYLTYYFKLAGVNNALGLAQMAYAVQLFGNICSWPLVDRVGRRPLIVGGMNIMTAALLIIGGISTMKDNKDALKATVSFMTIWGFLYQATIGAVAYAVGGETASPSHRQKTYSINIMSATAVSCLVLQTMPYMINPDKANLGGKISFVFFAPSVPMCIYLYFCLPEMKGRNYAEIEEMFQNKVPARKFKTYVCHGAQELTEVVREAEQKGVEVETREAA